MKIKFSLFRNFRILVVGCAVACSGSSLLSAQELKPTIGNQSTRNNQHQSRSESAKADETDLESPPIISREEFNLNVASEPAPLIGPVQAHPEAIPDGELQLFKAIPMVDAISPQAENDNNVRHADMTVDQDSIDIPMVDPANHLQTQSPYGGQQQIGPQYPGQVRLNGQRQNQIFPGNSQRQFNPLIPRAPMLPSTSRLFGNTSAQPVSNQGQGQVPIVTPGQLNRQQPVLALPSPPNSPRDMVAPGPIFESQPQSGNVLPQNGLGQSVIQEALPNQYFNQGQDHFYENGQAVHGDHGGYQNGGYQNDGYGNGGYQGGGYQNGDSIDEYFKCCGFVCDACSYFIGEALYWEREDGKVIGGNFFSIDDFDRQLGGRFTYGRRWDEMSGWELSIMGFDSFIAHTEQRDPQARLQGNLRGTLTGFNNSFFTSFRNDQFLDQRQKSNLFSIESNRVWFGWDVAKFFYGVRYINFDDDFRMTSQNVNGQIGLYDMEIDNRMFGAHIGGELFHDVGYRLSFSMKAKLGAYVNFIEGDTRFFNNLTPVLINGDEDTDIAYSAELGIMAHYQLLPRLRMTGGYEFLSLIDVATTAQNFNPITTPSTGTFYRTDDDAFFHGFSVGVEMYR